MLRIFYRVLFLLFVIAGLRLSAQVSVPPQSRPSEVALWTVGSFMADTQLTDEEGDYLDVFFEEEPGLGVSFNHYWTDHFSTEVSLMTFRADLSVGSALIQEPVRIGELDGRAVTAMAQWHFRQGARVMPYLAGGIAHIGGTFDPVDDEETDGGSIDLESNVTWTAAAGLDIRLTDHFLLCLEAKRVPWNAVEEGGSVEDAIDIDPMLYGSGVRFRF
jgi:outer membrane protein W